MSIARRADEIFSRDRSRPIRFAQVHGGDSFQVLPVAMLSDVNAAPSLGEIFN